MRRSNSDLAHLPNFTAKHMHTREIVATGDRSTLISLEKNAMFNAMLLICHMNAVQGCAVVTDSWGPYKTKEECMARVEVMIGNVQQLTPFMIVSGVRCATEVGEQT